MQQKALVKGLEKSPKQLKTDQTLQEDDLDNKRKGPSTGGISKIKSRQGQSKAPNRFQSILKKEKSLKKSFRFFSDSNRAIEEPRSLFVYRQRASSSN